MEHEESHEETGCLSEDDIAIWLGLGNRFQFSKTILSKKIETKITKRNKNLNLNNYNSSFNQKFEHLVNLNLAHRKKIINMPIQETVSQHVYRL
jgi:hypothetical protein